MYQFKTDDIFVFANDIGAKYRDTGREVLFKECPYCKGGGHDFNTFSINKQNGQFKCFRSGCGVQGNMTTLLKHFDMFKDGSGYAEYYRPQNYKYLTIAEPKINTRADSLIQYFENRCIPKEIVEKYEIINSTKYKGYAIFYFRDENGKICMAKYRKFDSKIGGSKEFAYSDDTGKNLKQKPILFGMNHCKSRERLVVTEGQIDALSLAAAGIENPVSVPYGAQGFTFFPHCFNFLQEFKEIVIFGDLEKDRKTVTLFHEFVSILGKKVLCVRPEDYKDCKDANEILIKYGKEQLYRAIQNAERAPVRKVLVFSDITDIDPIKIPKVRTGISTLDEKLVGGLPFYEVSIVAGSTGDGKTTLTSQFALKCVEQGHKVFIYSGEMSCSQTKNKILKQAANDDDFELNDSNYPELIDASKSKINEWLGSKIYVYDTDSVDDEEEGLFNMIKELNHSYGIDVCILDNLMTAMYMENDDAQELERQGRFMNELTKLAKRLRMLIVLVAHKRKTNSYASGINDEISGSKRVADLSGVIISYDRPTDKDKKERDFTDEDRKIILSKNRLFGKLHFEGIKVHYNARNNRIYETNAEKDYTFPWKPERDRWKSVYAEIPIPTNNQQEINLADLPFD